MDGVGAAGQRQGEPGDPAIAALETGLTNAVDGFSRDAAAQRQELASLAPVGDTKQTYTREFLLSLKTSPLVGAGIGLEGELWRDLSCEAEADQLYDPRFAELSGIHDGMMRKEEAWRTANQRHKTSGIPISGSPSSMGGPQAWPPGDGSVAASPERPIPQSGPGLHRGAGPGWRRPAGQVSEHDEDPRIRTGIARGSVRDDVERERKLSSSAGHDEIWRPGPPGLGRSTMQRSLPPGLGSGPGDLPERPWGAGRGRLPDGERRMSGKPRDPPVEMPRHETARDPQLPEGWNRLRNRSQVADWRTGKGKEDRLQSGLAAGLHSDRLIGNRQDDPAWLTADDTADYESQTSAETRRMEFEAEHNKLRGEREANSSVTGIMVEISHEEIEAMKQQSLAEEIAAVGSVKSQIPSRPQSAMTLSEPIDQFRNNLAGQFEDGQRVQEELAKSRFSRFFNQGPAAPISTPQLTNLTNLANPSSGLPVKSAQPVAGGFSQNVQEMSQLQAYMTSRAPSAAGSVQSDLSVPQRNLLAQLQAKGSGTFTGQAFQQNTQPQMIQPGLSKAQMERYLMENNLMSPRTDQAVPGGMPSRVGQQPQLGHGASNAHLLSILQGQQGLRSQESAASQLTATPEPSFANPNPTMQQQQNLLNALSLGGQHQQHQHHSAETLHGAQGFSDNLLEQLQRMKFANDHQQQQHRIQQMQQSQQGQVQSNGLLAAFSAHMPRDAGAPKQLPDDIFSFNPNHQLNRLPQTVSQQPPSLGLGKNDRMPPPASQASNSIAHLLQTQQLSQRNAYNQQNVSGLSNGLYGLQQQQANASQLAQLRSMAGQGLSNFPQYGQTNQSGVMGQGTQPLGGADPQQIARFLEQQRQAQQAHLMQQVAQQHQAQARLINTQRLYQMQVAQQQATQQQQQRAQALLQQQQLQQQLAALPQNQLSTEALLRQQQLLQQMGVGNQGTTGLANDQDTNLLARLFANSGGMNNLPGRGR